MKNRNRTGRQKYFSADRRCKDCVYNGGRCSTFVFCRRTCSERSIGEF